MFIQIAFRQFRQIIAYFPNIQILHNFFHFSNFLISRFDSIEKKCFFLSLQYHSSNKL